MNAVTVTVEIRTSVPRTIYRREKNAGTIDTVPMPGPSINHPAKVFMSIFRFFNRYRSSSIINS